MSANCQQKIIRLEFGSVSQSSHNKTLGFFFGDCETANYLQGMRISTLQPPLATICYDSLYYYCLGCLLSGLLRFGWGDAAGWHNNIYRKMGKGSFIVAEPFRALVEKATCSQWPKSRALRLQGTLSQSTGANRICGGRRAELSIQWVEASQS